MSVWICGALACPVPIGPQFHDHPRHCPGTYLLVSLAGQGALPIGEKPMVLYQLERLQRCRRLDRLVLATSDHSSDDTLADLVSAAGFSSVSWGTS